MEAARNILLLDGDEQSALDIQRFLKVSAYTFTISHATDVQEGINYLKNRQPDLVLLAVEQVSQQNFSVFKQLCAKSSTPVILLSDLNQEETQRSAEIAGATDYLVKNKINLFHLQKSIVNALKLSEAESKLDHTVHEFANQHKSLYKVLDKLSSGVLVINSTNSIRYANANAYSILSDDSFRNQVADQLRFRDAEEEEIIELAFRKKSKLRISISNIDWGGDPANLFLLDRTESHSANAPSSIFDDQQVQTLLNAVRGNVLVLKENRFLFANKPALQQLKLKWVDLQGKNVSDVFDAKDLVSGNVSVQSFLSGKHFSGAIKQVDGTLLPVTFVLQPLSIETEFYQFLNFEIHNLNEEQHIPGARNDEDRFSSESVLHLASHDLREPVRTILNYVQLISENLQNKKYEEATEYAHFAKDAASRMEKLLTDLKTFIGLNEHKFALTKVSMKIALSDVLKQMKPKIDELQAEISFTELPDVSADRELVEKLLYHLIDNALKFRKKDKKPVIDIGFDKFEGNFIFCVRDNGLGISKKYYNKIFDLFERLNRVDEFPGNGLGLAICKKITELHGGEVWVESLPGSGSNFYFTLKGK